MISVIIPTLFRIDRIYQTIDELSKCDIIGKIILIDNTGIDKDIKLPKVKYILEDKNTYINPAWNKGINISTYDKICVLNDDIWFDWSKMQEIHDMINTNIGLIGMSNDNYHIPSNEFKISEIPPDWKTNKGQRPVGYACCFFIHKSNWAPIPNEIKLWVGDDFLFYMKNGLRNYLIEGIKCDGYISGTLDDKSLQSEFDPIKINDISLIKKQIELGIIENFIKGTIWDNN